MISYLTKYENSYFKKSDSWTNEIQGYYIPLEWWSRVYEYPWALEFADKNMVVADMGCGWEQRPFKDMLSKKCEKVYAVDQHWEAGKLEPHDNMQFVIADFTKRIAQIPDGNLGTIFCISVLEELGDKLEAALQEFYRCLRRGGLCVITCDVKYDIDKPHGPFGDVDTRLLFKYIIETGFVFKGDHDLSKANAIHNDDFNLCVLHCLLEKP